MFAVSLNVFKPPGFFIDHFLKQGFSRRKSLCCCLGHSTVAVSNNEVLTSYYQPFNSQHQRTSTPILSPYVSYKSTRGKLLKYQDNLSWVIISLILVTSGVEKALILQGEIR